jgi:hypothetical protein
VAALRDDGTDHVDQLALRRLRNLKGEGLLEYSRR